MALLHAKVVPCGSLADNWLVGAATGSVEMFGRAQSKNLVPVIASLSTGYKRERLVPLA